MMTYYVYEVYWFDNEDYTEHMYFGAVFGTSYSEAVANVTKYYGDDQTLSIKLTAIDEVSVPTLELSEVEAKRLIGEA